MFRRLQPPVVNMRKRIIKGFAFGLLFSAYVASGLPITNDPSLIMPVPGSYQLRILAPDLLELDLINSKGPDPARVTSWDFVSAAGQQQLPSPQDLAVTVNGQPISVLTVGFKRRPLYAPLKQRDLRIGNSLFVQLAAPIAEGQSVQVQSVAAASWPGDSQFVATMDPLRLNPAIHVNQVGYVPSFPKKAMIGYYLGSLGEMKIGASGGFKLVDAKTGAEVFQGALRTRADLGYT